MTASFVLVSDFLHGVTFLPTASHFGPFWPFSPAHAQNRSCFYSRFRKLEILMDRFPYDLPFLLRSLYHAKIYAGLKNGICNAKCLEFWVQRVCLFNFFDSTQKAYLYTISCRFRAIKHRFLFAGEKISHASRVESHRKWRHVGMISDACLIHLVVSSATFFTGCDRPRLNPVNLTGTCEAFLRLVRFDLRC